MTKLNQVDKLCNFNCFWFQVVYIMLRKTREKTFKGSVFIEFATENEAKAFLALESVRYDGEELIRKSK